MQEIKLYFIHSSQSSEVSYRAVPAGAGRGSVSRFGTPQGAAAMTWEHLIHLNHQNQQISSFLSTY